MWAFAELFFSFGKLGVILDNEGLDRWIKFQLLVADCGGASSKLERIFDDFDN